MIKQRPPHCASTTAGHHIEPIGQKPTSTFLPASKAAGKTWRLLPASRRLLAGVFILTLAGLSLSFSSPFCACSVYVPNVFSPDGDGDPANETFRPFLPGDCLASEYEIKIFDRRGHLVFQSSNIEEGWDGAFKGQPLPANVYVYMIKINLSGDPEGKPELITGDVALIRNR